MDLEALLGQWRAAEAKLYPMVVVNPHQYEANLELVRAMTDDLTAITSVDDLVAAYAERHDRLAAAVESLQRPPPSPEVALLLIDAAFSGRYRELSGERAKAEAERRIAQADEGWITLDETGDESGAGGTGFRRIEMRLPDGLGLHTYIDVDPTTFLPLYGIETLQLDPATGEFAGTNARPDRTEFGDRREWLTAIAAIKAT